MSFLSFVSEDSVIRAGTARQAGCIARDALTSECNGFSFVACLSVQRICLTLPDVFVSPNTWASHSSLLASVLSNAVGDHSLPGDQRQREIQRLLLENLTDIRRRNDAMLFRNLPPRALERLGSMVVDIQVSLLYRRLADLAALSTHRNSIRYLLRLTCQQSVSFRRIQVTARHRFSPKSLTRSSPGP